MLCQYKNIFGSPKEGFHSLRLFGFAANDLIGTVVIVAIIIYLFKMNFINSTILIIFVVLFIVIIHRIFCVNTTLNKLIFGTV